MLAFVGGTFFVPVVPFVPFVLFVMFVLLVPFVPFVMILKMVALWGALPVFILGIP